MDHPPPVSPSSLFAPSSGLVRSYSCSDLTTGEWEEHYDQYFTRKCVISDNIADMDMDVAYNTTIPQLGNANASNDNNQDQGQQNQGQQAGPSGQPAQAAAAMDNPQNVSLNLPSSSNLSSNPSPISQRPDDSNQSDDSARILTRYQTKHLFQLSHSQSLTQLCTSPMGVSSCPRRSRSIPNTKNSVTGQNTPTGPINGPARKRKRVVDNSDDSLNSVEDLEVDDFHSAQNSLRPPIGSPSPRRDDDVNTNTNMAVLDLDISPINFNTNVNSREINHTSLDRKLSDIINQITEFSLDPEPQSGAASSAIRDPQPVFNNFRVDHDMIDNLEDLAPLVFHNQAFSSEPTTVLFQVDEITAPPQARTTLDEYIKLCTDRAAALVRANYFTTLARKQFIPLWTVNFHPDDKYISTQAQAEAIVQTRLEIGTTWLNSYASILQAHSKELKTQSTAKLAALEKLYENAPPNCSDLAQTKQHVSEVVSQSRSTTFQFYQKRFTTIAKNPKGALWGNFPPHIRFPDGVTPLNVKRQSVRLDRGNSANAPNRPAPVSSNNENRGRGRGRGQDFRPAPPQQGPSGGKKRFQSRSPSMAPRKRLNLEQKIDRAINRALNRQNRQNRQ